MNVNLTEVLDSNHDTYMFLPMYEGDNLQVSGSAYKDPGSKLDGSVMGDCYHIILFRDEDENGDSSLDKFEAILSAPVVYMNRMIKEGWYGIICRKTTTSSEFVEDTFAKFKEVC